MKTKIDKIKKYITEEMLNENDTHSNIINLIKNRVGSNIEILNELTIVHNTRIRLLEKIYNKIQEIEK